MNNVIRKEHCYDDDVIVRLMLSSCLNLDQLTSNISHNFGFESHVCKFGMLSS